MLNSRNSGQNVLSSVGGEMECADDHVHQASSNVGIHSMVHSGGNERNHIDQLAHSIDNYTDRSTVFTSSFSHSSRNTSISNSIGNLSSVVDAPRVFEDSDSCSVLSSGCSTVIGRTNRTVQTSAWATFPVAPPSSPSHSSRYMALSTTAQAENRPTDGPSTRCGQFSGAYMNILSLPSKLTSELCDWNLDACALEQDSTAAQGDETPRNNMMQKHMAADADDQRVDDEVEDDAGSEFSESVDTSLAVEVSTRCIFSVTSPI